MPEYTYEDVIIDPKDQRLEGAIGKECYFGNETQHAIEDANENNNLAILEQVDSSRPTSPFCLYMTSYNDRFSVTCIILKKEEQMPEYTYKDIIIDPTSEEAMNCIGKEVYFSDNIRMCLCRANKDINGFTRILQEINENDYRPFKVNDNYYQVIIPKKVESEPEYVPFESKEEFINHYAYHNDKLTESSLAYQISSFGGIFLKDKDSDDYFMVTEILKYGVVIGKNHLATTWKDIIGGYLFLDGTPCGKIKE